MTGRNLLQPEKAGSRWGTDWVIPGDSINSDLNRGFDSYRLIQKNRSDIIDEAFAAMIAFNPGFVVPNGDEKCKRDIGYFVDAVSLDVLLGGGNRYTRKFIQNYFNSAGTAWLSNTLEGEQSQSIQAFEVARDLMNQAVTNRLDYKDLTLTADPVSGSNINFNSCANIRSTITSLTTLVTERITANSLAGLPAETIGLLAGEGSSICQRDIGYIVDGVVADSACFKAFQSNGIRYRNIRADALPQQGRAQHCLLYRSNWAGSHTPSRWRATARS